MPEEVTQGLVDRQGLLGTARETVEVVADPGFQVAQFKVQLTTAPELEAEQEHPPAKEEPPVIDHHRLKAGVGQSGWDDWVFS